MMKYYEDVDRRQRDVIVQWREDNGQLEYMEESDPVWKPVWKGASYYWEIFLGQGNNCLFPISAEDAERTCCQWQRK